MPTLTLPNGTVLTQTTRASCLDRLWAIPLGSYAYSQARVEESTDRRADCTGWLSYVLDTPKSGPGIYLHAYNTGSFFTQKVITPVRWADLLPGDLVGFFAANSPGNGGHAAVWLDGERRPDGRFQVSDHGSGMGPKLRWVKWDGVSTGWLHPDHLGAWRYVGITEEGDDTMSVENARLALLQLTAEAAERGTQDGRNFANRLYAIIRAAGLDQVVTELAAQRVLLDQVLAKLGESGPSGGLTAAEVRAVVDEELDEAFTAAADKD